MQSNCVVLDRGNQTSCSINLVGATIVSWKIKNVEQIFSCINNVTTGAPLVYGGIQIIFPQFGTLGECDEVKGFANRALWRLHKKPRRMPNSDIETSLELTSCDWSQQFWRSNFSLIYSIILRRDDLFLELSVVNPSNDRIKFHVIINVYFKVVDIMACEISGLQNCKVLENKVTTPSSTYTFVGRHDSGQIVPVPDCTEKIYLNAPDQTSLFNVGNAEIRIEKTGFRDVVVGNPWIPTSANVPVQTITEYISVGVGIAGKQICLDPGESFEGVLNIFVVQPEHKEEEEVNPEESPFINNHSTISYGQQ